MNKQQTTVAAAQVYGLLGTSFERLSSVRGMGEDFVVQQAVGGDGDVNSMAVDVPGAVTGSNRNSAVWERELEGLRDKVRNLDKSLQVFQLSPFLGVPKACQSSILCFLKA